MSLLIQKKWLYFLFIRPSRNPLDLRGFEHMKTGDIVKEKAEITRIHRFEFLNKI